ncbi:ADP-ribosylglycohydrolase family protein [Massilia sp. CCM 9210]|uniref:ADP-ribosylglycohydrolase family protein n=1 Tax=Massilia scottii TaxID=3057166 RepID=UPI002796A416|nr:ADP-ribosylglycohydrolase family protein [Massilia sp. CCM 9210]MDQ1811823.1 ADP-ribosylglycohydrolase family protein [Massilia sp. CCM 9210]
MTQRQPTHPERLAGGIVGLLVGDALGVPYEFHKAADIPPAALIDFTPAPQFQRSHQAVAPGTWSDDGAQALCEHANQARRVHGQALP